MKPEIKSIWVEALRGGEYKQGHRALHPGDNFCCLGVLCDLYHKATGLGEWVPAPGPALRSAMSFCGEIQYLPPEVQKWTGLENPKAAYLAQLNDTGTPFGNIAAIIEASY